MFRFWTKLRTEVVGLNERCDFTLVRKVFFFSLYWFSFCLTSSSCLYYPIIGMIYVFNMSCYSFVSYFCVSNKILIFYIGFWCTFSPVGTMFFCFLIIVPL